MSVIFRDLTKLRIPKHSIIWSDLSVFWSDLSIFWSDLSVQRTPYRRRADSAVRTPDLGQKSDANVNSRSLLYEVFA